MDTLMTSQTFDGLLKVRSEIISNVPRSSSDSAAVAGIFVPWAGSRLREKGGIYYVGIGTKGCYDGNNEQTFEACLERARALCINQPTSDFWQFLDGLSWALFGEPSSETTDRWGWSNLLKIGWSQGSPAKKGWPAQLVQRQTETCVAALGEELSSLKNSLVFFASFETFGVLDCALSQINKNSWKQKYEENWKKCDNAGIYWRKDQTKGNLYVHGYHPRAAVIKRCWGTALGYTVHLVRREMPGFAQAGNTGHPADPRR
jgi:hypothetical protein